MKRVTQEMLKIYKPLSGMDWMNYRLVKKEATFHHIVKKEFGGKETIENGCILMPIAHQYLHLIECKSPTHYQLLTKMFQLINSQKSEPTVEQREVIETILRDFEYIHRNDKNAKGKSMIKYTYKKREDIWRRY